MRRVVVVLVLALVGAGFAGRLVGANAAHAGDLSLSNSTSRAELSVLANSSSYQCYVNSEFAFNTSPSSTSVNSAAAAAWAKVQIEALAFESYLRLKYHWSPSASDLAVARAGLLNDYTSAAASAAASTGTQCPATASAAFATLPKWFQDREVLRNAASIELLKRIGTVTPVTTAGLESFFNANPRLYDTICVSIAYVPAAQFNAFESARTSGASVASLARTYSADATTAKNGGALGCFAPSSTSYNSVRKFVINEPLNQFSPRYQPQQQGSAVYVLFVAPTKLTPSTFAASEQQVLSDVQLQNSNAAALAERAILNKANVALDPAFGVWSHTKVTVDPLRSPKLKFVANSAAGLSL